MSYIQIEDEKGEMMLVGLKRITKVRLSPRTDGLTELTLEPYSKDDPEELIYSTTPVARIWEQIKMRM